MRRAGAALVAAAALTLAACPLGDRQGDSALAANDPGYDRALQVRYLGVAGFVLRRGSDVVLTAPLYSNPDLFEESFTPILPDKRRIDRYHPDLHDVSAILVGHAHYDHLMDVPYVWARTPQARIFGSLTMKRILWPYTLPLEASAQRGFPEPLPRIPADRLVALNDPDDPQHNKLDTRRCAGEDPAPAKGRHACPRYGSSAGAWVSVTSGVRLRALCARHPAQFLRYHQAPGCQPEKLERLPRRVNDYREGETFAYLIDFLDSSGRPVYRVYYQDVPRDGAFAEVPPELFDAPDGRAVDLALLCAGNWQAVERGPAVDILDNTRARHVLLGHWENFFRPQGRRLEEAPFQDVRRYRRLVEQRLAALHPDGGYSLSMPVPQLTKCYDIEPGACRRPAAH